MYGIMVCIICADPTEKCQLRLLQVFNNITVFLGCPYKNINLGSTSKVDIDTYYCLPRIGNWCSVCCNERLIHAF